MNTVVSLTLEQLTARELLRVYETIRRKYEARLGSALVAIGFGRRIKRGKISRSKLVVVRICLKSKRKRVPKCVQVPYSDEVFLFRERRRCVVRFETDVLKHRQAVKTSGFGNVGSAGSITGKVLIRWRTPPEDWHWGILTVGHGNFSVGSRPKIRLSSHSHVAEMVLKSTEPFDVGVFEILLPQELADLGMITIDPPSPAIPLFDKLLSEENETVVMDLFGETWRESSKRKFRSRTFYPEFVFSNGDKNSYMLEVTSVDKTFTMSTSGSPWTISTSGDGNDVLGWIQLGAKSEDGEANIGLGQHIQPMLAWAKKSLKAEDLVVVEFRFDLPG